MRALLFFVPLLALTVMTVPAAGAEELDDANKAAARSLGYEGVESYQRGDYAGASERLERAFQVMRAPSLGLWSARALEKLGRLVEASERYLDVTRLDVGGGEAAVQKQAQAEAATEREALLPRIPSLLLKVEGAERSAVQCSVDAVSVPAALIGVGRPVNPGTHRVEVRFGAQTKTEQVTLAEGEKKEVALRFEAASQSPSPEPPAPSTMPPAERPPVATPASPASSVSRSSSIQRTLGFVAVGVGGAALVGGGVATLLALNKRSSLSEQCPNDECLPSAHAGADSYNSLRMLSAIGVIGGVVLGSVGVVLLVTAPARADAQASRGQLNAWVRLGSAGISGAF
jgi:hypothetical protein